jgi:general L-amino acid transport system substrate-binding protein
VPGFSEADASGRYQGLDIDICRGLAAAIFGTADKTRFIAAPSIADFLRNDEIDVVSRRLTWELRREGTTGLLFGPVTFYDGQAILVAKAAGISSASGLAKTPVCVAGGLPWQVNLAEYFKARSISLEKIVLESAHDYADIAARLSDGRCRAYSGDLSDLAAIRSRMTGPDAFVILPERLSKEPLAPVLRDDDAAFFTLVRWTVFALMAAEELGVTAANVDAMRASENLDVQRLLGAQPGNGKTLGLNEAWAYQAIKAVGNYGEIFERNLGSRSAIKLDRGLNQLWTNGGLMYAPPVR